MPKLRMKHSTVAILLNKSGDLSTFLVSTYCPPDERNDEAMEELKNILLSINQCFRYPKIIVFSDTNRHLL